MNGQTKDLICFFNEVPLQQETDKKIDSEIVREGNVKSTQYKESEKFLKFKLIST
jgi:hypothetical protein